MALIVVGVDGSEGSKAALRLAGGAPQRHHAICPVVIVPTAERGNREAGEQ
jgi:hypothetical protein